MNGCVKCVSHLRSALLIVSAIFTASCIYHGGEREKHEVRSRDGKTVTCFEPPPEVVKKASIETDIEASIMEIGKLARATVRGEATPERIREKLPSNVAAFEVIEFRLCTGYANGLYSPEEYRAFLDAKSALLSKPSRKSPVREGVLLESVRRQLMDFIDEGNAIVKYLDTSPTNVTQESKVKVKTWITRTQTYLEQTFSDPAYTHRFKNFFDLPSARIPAVPSFNDEWVNYRGAVTLRQTRLNQYIDAIE